MALWKVLKFALIGVLVLAAVSVVLSVLGALVSLVWALVSAVVSLAVLAGLGYAGYRTYTWLRSDSAEVGQSSRDTDRPTGPSADSQTDRVERLKQQYADGRLSESELERRLDRTLDEPDVGRIERELDRER